MTSAARCCFYVCFWSKVQRETPCSTTSTWIRLNDPGRERDEKHTSIANILGYILGYIRIYLHHGLCLKLAWHTLTHFRHVNPISDLSDIRKGAAASRPPNGNGWNTSIKVSRHLRTSQDQIQHGPHGWFIYLYIGSHCQNEMEHRMWYNMIKEMETYPWYPFGNTSQTLHKHFTNAAMAVELQHVKFAMLNFSEEINPVFRMCTPIPAEVDFPADHLLCTSCRWNLLQFCYRFAQICGWVMRPCETSWDCWRVPVLNFAHALQMEYLKRAILRDVESVHRQARCASMRASTYSASGISRTQALQRSPAELRSSKN